MKQVVLFVIFLSGSIPYMNAQIIQNRGNNITTIYGRDSIQDNQVTIELDGKTTYTDYKIFSYNNQISYIDTTLTIRKEYKFNYLRKDNFGLLAFHNQGQTFTNLSHNFNNQSIAPNMGMNAKHFNYEKTNDIRYYEVPTPTTEIAYRTGLQQGQVLESLFTLNFSKRKNAAIKYKGLRSLGVYRNSLASHGNFSTMYRYNTKNERYYFKGHISTQDLFNNESGGLTPTSLAAFINEDPNFSNRGRLDVNLEGTETELEGERFHISHNYKLFSKKDSLEQQFSNLKIGHEFTHENKIYTFTESQLNTAVFGNSNTTAGFEDVVENKSVSNQLFLDFNSKYILGNFKVKTTYLNYSYGYNSILNTQTATVTSPKLKGSVVSFGADWNARLGNFDLKTTSEISPGSNRLSGSNFSSSLHYRKDSLLTVNARILLNSKSPNFNTLLYQSSYDAYNWQNDSFKNINTRSLLVSTKMKWLQLNVTFTNIENYTYFDSSSKPKQSGENVSYLKVKLLNEFTFGKFSLNNTMLYQNVSNGKDVFRVPNFVTRNTFYYSDFFFKGNPLYLQTGITFNYFSKFKANAFNPLLNEFTIQNSTEIGFPSIDVFVNAQIRRTRIYLKADNISSTFLKKNYFSAPNYPYRDFVIRFGLVWNWFI